MSEVNRWITCHSCNYKHFSSSSSYFLSLSLSVPKTNEREKRDKRLNLFTFTLTTMVVREMMRKTGIFFPKIVLRSNYKAISNLNIIN